MKGDPQPVELNGSAGQPALVLGSRKSVGAFHERTLEPSWNLSPRPFKLGGVASEKSTNYFKQLNGGRTRTRTLDPLIKSQLLPKLNSREGDLPVLYFVAFLQWSLEVMTNGVAPECSGDHAATTSCATTSCEYLAIAARRSTNGCREVLQLLQVSRSRRKLAGTRFGR